jgi:hypothetical protein
VLYRLFAKVSNSSIKAPTTIWMSTVGIRKFGDFSIEEIRFLQCYAGVTRITNIESCDTYNDFVVSSILR